MGRRGKAARAGGAAGGETGRMETAGTSTRSARRCTYSSCSGSRRSGRGRYQSPCCSGGGLYKLNSVYP
jgi:hypothetical protein